MKDKSHTGRPEKVGRKNRRENSKCRAKNRLRYHVVKKHDTSTILTSTTSTHIPLSRGIQIIPTIDVEQLLKSHIHVIMAATSDVDHPVSLSQKIRLNSQLIR